ncbi:hypothetical protein [Streptomyces sp. NPDC007856]|uniref:hypothetical protein n=1 Tax=Streptomyces sp. NPDC007856 TaxID=3364781 RepID=UPI003681975D
MRKLTKRFALAVASTAVAGGAVLGAGGTASAATPLSEHVQRSAVSIKTDGHRWDRDVSYRHGHEYKYCRDDYRGRQRNIGDRYTYWDRYDRHVRYCSWDDEYRGRQHDRNYRYDRESNRYDYDWNRYDRNSYRNDHGSFRNDGDWNRYDHDGNRNR